jgi:hypothetical protein
MRSFFFVLLLQFIFFSGTLAENLEIKQAFTGINCTAETYPLSLVFFGALPMFGVGRFEIQF